MIPARNDKEWVAAKIKQRVPEKIVANSGNKYLIEKVNARMIRITFFKHASKQVAVSEVEFY